MKLLRWAVAFTSLLVAGLAAAQTFSIVPASPRYQEPVYLRIVMPDGYAPWDTAVSMQGAEVAVTYRISVDTGLGGPKKFYDVFLGRFPAGSYSVRIRTGVSSTASAAFTVTGAQNNTVNKTDFAPPVDYSGLWWTPTEAGWGLGIFQGPPGSGLFAAWFAYDKQGNPAWYSVQYGDWVGPSGYKGTLIKTTGPWFGGPFDPAAVIEQNAGEVNFFFKDAFHGVVSFKVDGTFYVKDITRFDIP